MAEPGQSNNPSNGPEMTEMWAEFGSKLNELQTAVEEAGASVEAAKIDLDAELDKKKALIEIKARKDKLDTYLGVVGEKLKKLKQVAERNKDAFESHAAEQLSKADEVLRSMGEAKKVLEGREQKVSGKAEQKKQKGEKVEATLSTVQETLKKNLKIEESELDLLEKGLNDDDFLISGIDLLNNLAKPLKRLSTLVEQSAQWEASIGEVEQITENLSGSEKNDAEQLIARYKALKNADKDKISAIRNLAEDIKEFTRVSKEMEEKGEDHDDYADLEDTLYEISQKITEKDARLLDEVGINFDVASLHEDFKDEDKEYITPWHYTLESLDSFNFGIDNPKKWTDVSNEECSPENIEKAIAKIEGAKEIFDAFSGYEGIDDLYNETNIDKVKVINDLKATVGKLKFVYGKSEEGKDYKKYEDKDYMSLYDRKRWMAAAENIEAFAKKLNPAYGGAEAAVAATTSPEADKDEESKERLYKAFYGSVKVEKTADGQFLFHFGEEGEGKGVDETASDLSEAIAAGGVDVGALFREWAKDVAEGKTNYKEYEKAEEIELNITPEEKQKLFDYFYNNIKVEKKDDGQVDFWLDGTNRAQTVTEVADFIGTGWFTNQEDDLIGIDQAEASKAFRIWVKEVVEAGGDYQEHVPGKSLKEEIFGGEELSPEEKKNKVREYLEAEYEVIIDNNSNEFLVKQKGTKDTLSVDIFKSLIITPLEKGKKNGTKDYALGLDKEDAEALVTEWVEEKKNKILADTGRKRTSAEASRPDVGSAADKTTEPAPAESAAAGESLVDDEDHDLGSIEEEVITISPEQRAHVNAWFDNNIELYHAGKNKIAKFGFDGTEFSKGELVYYFIDLKEELIPGDLKNLGLDSSLISKAFLEWADGEHLKGREGEANPEIRDAIETYKRYLDSLPVYIDPKTPAGSEPKYLIDYLNDGLGGFLPLVIENELRNGASNFQDPLTSIYGVDSSEVADIFREWWHTSAEAEAKRNEAKRQYEMGDRETQKRNIENWLNRNARLRLDPPGASADEALGYVIEVAGLKINSSDLRYGRRYFENLPEADRSNLEALYNLTNDTRLLENTVHRWAIDKYHDLLEAHAESEGRAGLVFREFRKLKIVEDPNDSESYVVVAPNDDGVSFPEEINNNNSLPISLIAAGFSMYTPEQVENYTGVKEMSGNELAELFSMWWETAKRPQLEREKPREKKVIDIPENELFSIVGRERLASIMEECFVHPLTGRGNISHPELELQGLFMDMDPVAAERLQRNLDKFGYTVEEFKKEWREKLYLKVFNALSGWVQKEELRVLNDLLGDGENQSLEDKLEGKWRKRKVILERAKLMAANLAPTAVGMGAGVAMTMVTGIGSMGIRALSGGLVGAATGATKGIDKAFGWLRKRKEKAKKQAKEKTQEALEEVKEKNALEIQHRLEEKIRQVSSRGIAAFLSQGLREGSYDSYDKKDEDLDVNAFLLKEGLAGKIGAEYEGAELEHQEKKLKSLVKELNTVQNQERDKIADIMSKNPKFVAILEKALGYPTGTLTGTGGAEGRTSSAEENKAKTIIVSMLVGGTMGSVFAAFPEARAIVMTAVGGYVGYKIGESRDEKAKEKAFVTEVVNKINTAEELISGYDIKEGTVISVAAKDKAARPSDSALEEYMRVIRTPLNLGLLEEHPSLSVRAKNVLRRIDELRYEIRRKDDRAEALLAALHSDVHKLQEERQETIENLQTTGGWRKYAGAVAGGAIGAAVGYGTRHAVQELGSFLNEETSQQYHKILQSLGLEEVAQPDSRATATGVAAGAAESLSPAEAGAKAPEVREVFKLPEYLKIEKGSHLGMSHTATADVILNEKVQQAYIKDIPALKDYAGKFDTWKTGLAEHNNNLEDYAKSLSSDEEKDLRRFAYLVSEYNNFGDVKVRGGVATIFDATSGKHKIIALDASGNLDLKGDLSEQFYRDTIVQGDKKIILPDESRGANFVYKGDKIPQEFANGIAVNQEVGTDGIARFVPTEAGIDQVGRLYSGRVGAVDQADWAAFAKDGSIIGHLKLSADGTKLELTGGSELIVKEPLGEAEVKVGQEEVSLDEAKEKDFLAADTTDLAQSSGGVYGTEKIVETATPKAEAAAEPAEPAAASGAEMASGYSQAEQAYISKVDNDMATFRDIKLNASDKAKSIAESFEQALRFQKLSLGEDSVFTGMQIDTSKSPTENLLATFKNLDAESKIFLRGVTEDDPYFAVPEGSHAIKFWDKNVGESFFYDKNYNFKPAPAGETGFLVESVDGTESFLAEVEVVDDKMQLVRKEPALPKAA